MSPARLELPACPPCHFPLRSTAAPGAEHPFRAQPGMGKRPGAGTARLPPWHRGCLQLSRAPPPVRVSPQPLSFATAGTGGAGLGPPCAPQRAALGGSCLSPPSPPLRRPRTADPGGCSLGLLGLCSPAAPTAAEQILLQSKGQDPAHQQRSRQPCECVQRLNQAASAGPAGSRPPEPPPTAGFFPVRQQFHPKPPSSLQVSRQLPGQAQDINHLSCSDTAGRNSPPSEACRAALRKPG